MNNIPGYILNTEQQQIDDLKRRVARLEHVILQYAESIQRVHYALTTTQATCPDCGIMMYEGFSCNRPAPNCSMGVGVPDELG